MSFFLRKPCNKAAALLGRLGPRWLPKHAIPVTRTVHIERRKNKAQIDESRFSAETSQSLDRASFEQESRIRGTIQSKSAYARAAIGVARSNAVERFNSTQLLLLLKDRSTVTVSSIVNFEVFYPTHCTVGCSTNLACTARLKTRGGLANLAKVYVKDIVLTHNLRGSTTPLSIATVSFAVCSVIAVVS